jgi:thiol-disulfide isomerase/thioredoxin
MSLPSRRNLVHGIGCLAASFLISTATVAAPATAATPTTPKAAAANRSAPTTPTAAPGADGTAEVSMQLLQSGAMEKLGGYSPQQVKMVKGKPAALKNAPEMKNPLYGQIKFAGKTYVMAVDEPKGEDAKLYVDANGNGDLADDPAPKWEKKEGAGPNGVQLTQYSGSFELPLGTGEKAEMVSLGCYRFDPNDPQRGQLKTTFLYYTDYAYDGEVTLGGKTYKAMLTDDTASGQFAPAAGATNRFLIDINGDGKFTARGEVYKSSEPFNVKGTTWALAAGGADGMPFKVVKSDRKVPEVALPPNHSVGAKITPFKAKRLDGKQVSFPEDYKGKVVMLDFWATWCPPCREEIPGLVSAYSTYHDKGLEVLGISLDQANQANEVKAFMKEQGMTWPQVYDGKFWKAAVADKYGINSIPATFLVDGDSGIVLAAGGALRGGALDATLQKALEKKSSGKPEAAANATNADQAKAEQKPEAPADAQPAEKAADAAEEKPAEPAAPKAEEKKEALPF